jgi:hypothetical protein
MTAIRTPSSLTLNCRSAAGCKTAKPFIILVLHSVIADDRSLAHLNFSSPSIRHERIYEFLSFIGPLCLRRSASADNHHAEIVRT